MTACVIMYNMIIKNECGQELDYTHYDLMGVPVQVLGGKPDWPNLFSHTMPFVKEKCMINFNLISSRSGGSGMGNNKVNLFYHLLYCYGRRETRHLFIHLNYSLLCCNNSTIYCWFYLCVFALSDLEIPGQGKNMNKEEGSQKSETRWIEMDNSDIAIKTPVSLKKKNRGPSSCLPTIAPCSYSRSKVVIQTAR
jgi:hypothetical protein